MNVIQKAVVNWYNWKRDYYSKKALRYYSNVFKNPDDIKTECKYQIAISKMNIARFKRDYYSEKWKTEGV